MRNSQPAQNWKRRLREDCLRRVRDNRASLISKIRERKCQSPGDTAEPMAELLQAVLSEGRKHAAAVAAPSRPTVAAGGETPPNDVGSPRTPTAHHAQLLDVMDLTPAEYADLMSAMEAELLQEEERLAKESQEAALADYEAACTAEAESDTLHAAQYVRDMEAGGEGGGGVLCPVCESAPVAQLSPGRAGAALACRNPACGMRLDCAAEGLGLGDLRAALADAIAAHGASGCPAKPRFAVRRMLFSDSLWMECAGCGATQVIL
mmetsp:Transcript_24123/g.57461  ORF Transcript_24123/g.57461 Transcript_24123/m.57461 type:complete len:264 (-) Transcript_24123:95-886(-)